MSTLIGLHTKDELLDIFAELCLPLKPVAAEPADLAD